MPKIRDLLAGAALAGSLAAAALTVVPAAASADAAAATPTSSATSATSVSAGKVHRFGPFFSGFGRGENRGHRSYATGSWSFKGGRYHLDFDLFDRDRDRQYSWFDVYYHDNRGWHAFARYRTFGHLGRHVAFPRDRRIDGFRFRVGEGTTRDYDWSGWHRYGRF
ncbi:hypothetical protein Sru01_06330 [Sphaerisporangium rufum]|uniref:Uncharacterized protein n=1 Tax=Sphaerisporangium rufum TaxID=1381558 RepID=A0A919QWZ3_9ACTN|nr:hypothetical protein [Sphaerisporangium rufum]GII75651.1 hypothetical protein Sru01_06330 [Sphaerisporangium rufum]